MSELTVAPHELGVLRVFSLNMRPEEAKFLREPGAAEQALGVADLDTDHIDVFPVSDLEDVGLYGYLNEGCGVSKNQLDAATLAALDGWVMVVRSAAFKGRAATLKPDPRLKLIGLFTEEATNWTGGHIETESAKPFSAAQAPQASDDNAPRFGSVLWIILILLVIGGVLWLIL